MPGRTAFRRPVGRAQPDRGQRGVLAGREPGDLVVLQGEQGRDDDRRTRQQGGRYLVDRRLPAARRQDGQRVSAGHDGAHRDELLGP
jgi:hypothetical protein